MGLLEDLLMGMLPVEQESVDEVFSESEPATVEKPQPKTVAAAASQPKPVKEEVILEEAEEEKKKFKVNARDMVIYSEIMKPKYLD